MNTLRRRAPGIAWAITAAVLYAAVGVGTSAPAGADESGRGPAAGADAPGTAGASNDPGRRRPGRDKDRIASGWTDPGGSAGGGAERPGDPCPWWPVPRPVPPAPPDSGDISRGNNGFIAVPAVVPVIPVPQFGAAVERPVDIDDLPEDDLPEDDLPEDDLPEDAPAVTAPAAAPSPAWYPAAPSPRSGPVVRVATAPVAPPPQLPSVAAVPPASMRSPAASPPRPQRPGAGVRPPGPVRLGYPDDLRDADLAMVVSTALPGLAAMAGMTAIGGLVGYRQARAGYLLRAAGAGRFLQ